MPNYLTLVIHVYPAKVSLRPVRLGNGLRPLPPSPAGLVATRHPAELAYRVFQQASSGPSQPRLTHPSRPSIKPFAPRLQDPTLHILNLPGQFTHCSITCWHTPSFPGKASQETGTLALAGPIQPAPRYVALTLIPRDELLPNTDITAGRLPKVSPPPRALRAIFDLGRTPTPTLSASSIHRHELSPAVLDGCDKHNYRQELNTRKSHLAHTSSDPAPTTPRRCYVELLYLIDKEDTDKSKIQTERYTRYENPKAAHHRGG